MPRRRHGSKKSSRTSTRRVRFSRRRRVMPRSVVNRSIGPLAPRFITKLKYCEQFNLSATAGLVAEKQYNMNSLFDPDRTGGGHQPYGFDQIVAMGYSQYRVFAISWRISVMSASSDNVVVVPLPSTITLPTTISEAMELPRAVSKVVVTAQPIMFKGHMSLPRLNGQTSREYIAEDANAALINANPATANILNIFGANYSTGTGVDVECVVTLQYHCQFWDPIVIAQS